MKKTPLLHVGLGSSHARLACERVPLAMRFGVRPPPPPVGQDRLILTCSGAGAPELQRWAQCLPVLASPPRREKYRNGIMKHPLLNNGPVEGQALNLRFDEEARHVEGQALNVSLP